MDIPFKSSAISAHRTQELHQDWQFAEADPGTVDAADLTSAALSWRSAVVPGTVAQSTGCTIDGQGPYDRSEWFYRSTFSVPNDVLGSSAVHRLRFEGLATLADVWLNGALILTADNMFRTYVVDVSALLQTTNELVIHFQSLASALEHKRPRPRWKTALTHHQNMRWFRTTFLGRIPAWSPPIEPVGPWRPITLETVASVDVANLVVQTRVENNLGVVEVHADIAVDTATLNAAVLVIGAESFQLSIEPGAAQCRISGRRIVPDAPLWWPHTHGTPALLPARIELTLASGTVVIDCGNIGFKQTVFNHELMELHVNGVPVFSRGACWTVTDFLSLNGSEEQLRTTLMLAKEANINMLRVGGTMVYEQDLFYRLCDEMGILVWQDFMFANLDYPVDDPVFRANIEIEVRQQLRRLQRHSCIAVYCGGSEIEQQAAMMGFPVAEWSNSFLAETLPNLCQQLHPGITYFRGSPSGGDLPFHVGTGVAHYYGVGAYRRPLSDAKHAGVKFASECLGISNVPAMETVTRLMDGRTPVPHHPVWKARVPRDNGAGYDFEDIRDFYLRELFQEDPVTLRSENPERYFAISRSVSGEMMLRTFAEWRRAGNPCHGGLIWFYKDLWPGAGWGIVDSENRPKAAYFYAQRAWASRTILMADDGLDGIKLLLINESAEAFDGEIEFGLLQHGKIKVLEQRHACSLAGRQQLELGADALVGHFTDCNYAYRFGPASADTIYCRLYDRHTQDVIGEDVLFPLKKLAASQDAGALQVEAELLADGIVQLSLNAQALFQDVSFTGTDYIPDANHFHVLPGRTYTVRFRSPTPVPKKFKVYVSALNLWEPVTVRVN